jgi:hypothetical protein
MLHLALRFVWCCKQVILLMRAQWGCDAPSGAQRGDGWRDGAARDGAARWDGGMRRLQDGTSLLFYGTGHREVLRCFGRDRVYCSVRGVGRARGAFGRAAESGHPGARSAVSEALFGITLFVSFLREWNTDVMVITWKSASMSHLGHGRMVQGPWAEQMRGSLHCYWLCTLYLLLHLHD